MDSLLALLALRLGVRERRLAARLLLRHLASNRLRILLLFAQKGLLVVIELLRGAFALALRPVGDWLLAQLAKLPLLAVHCLQTLLFQLANALLLPRDKAIHVLHSVLLR